jgi:hypothetical protein
VSRPYARSGPQVPLAAAAALAALAAGAAVVYLLPVLLVVMAGPVGFAASAVWVWAESRHIGGVTPVISVIERDGRA